MWPLLFQGQITMEGLEAHTVEEYVLYDSAEEDQNTWVDISDFKERKITAMTKYVQLESVSPIPFWLDHVLVPEWSIASL